MISRVAIAKRHSLITILKYTDIRSYVFTVVFVALSVATPWVFHQFHLAGPTFLPMHIFVLIAGLLFGWRAGLVVGLFTPLISYLVSGMPVARILPQIVIELCAYGLVAGILREKFNLRAVWSLLGAMIAGRLALLIGVVVMYFALGGFYSPLGAEASPFLSVWSSIKQGWPGMVVQLALIPPILWLLGELFAKTSKSR